MFKVGLSSCGFQIKSDILAELKKNGIEHIEVSLHPDAFMDFDYKEAKRLADEHGINLWSYHLPFLPFSKIEISVPDKAVRDYSVGLFSELIKKGADIGIDKYIVHPSGEPISEAERPERLKYSMQSLNTLAEIAAQNGAVICVEDLPRTCISSNIEDMKTLMSANDKLTVCFDVNHLLKDSHEDFIDAFADKIVTTHISDYDFIDERHWLPGEGKIDWQSLVKKLKEVGYNGVWMYELGFDEPKTLKRVRDLTCEDFATNAKCIFEGKTPPSFVKK